MDTERDVPLWEKELDHAGRDQGTGTAPPADQSGSLHPGASGCVRRYLKCDWVFGPHLNWKTERKREQSLLHSSLSVSAS